MIVNRQQAEEQDRKAQRLRSLTDKEFDRWHRAKLVQAGVAEVQRYLREAPEIPSEPSEYWKRILSGIYSDTEQREYQRKRDAEEAEEYARQLADPSTMTPDHPDYLRFRVHSMD